MGKQLLFDAIERKETERTPWVPFVGVHGGALIGVDAQDYLQSADYIVKGVEKGIEKYKPDGIPVAFDLQIEAEALGCQLQWSKENPPAVVEHVLAEKALTDLSIPGKEDGRIPIVLEATRNLKAKDYDVALYGLVTGPFTLALHLKGTEIFIEMYDNPDQVQELLKFTRRVAQHMADLYIQAGCDIIALVDPMTSQISPEAFKQFVLPHATECFDFIRQNEVYSSFFVCGHAQKNVEAMCRTGPDNISVDENIPLDWVKDVCQKYDVSYGGNLKLTVVLLMGSRDDVCRHTIKTMDLGDGVGFILAPGCDLPYGVPPENLEVIAEIVRDAYQQQVARELSKKEKNVAEGIDFSDYGQSGKVVVDIITLDSESCAPCQYMVEAVKQVAPHFKDLVIWREHTIKKQEAVEFMKGMMVKNIPTILIDGNIEFVSTIPSRKELVQAIQERINAKMFKKIRHRRNKLIVLGNQDEEQERTWQNVRTASRQLGSTVDILRVSNKREMKKYGVSALPAVVAEQALVKSTGKVPSVEVIMEWLKELE